MFTGILCPPCSVRNSHCHGCGAVDTFHYIEEGKEEFDIFQPLTDVQKYRVQETLKVEALINGMSSGWLSQCNNVLLYILDRKKT